MDIVHRILTFITRLTRLCLRSLNDRFVAWTTPESTSLLLLTLTDLARSKSELITENAFLLCWLLNTSVREIGPIGLYWRRADIRSQKCFVN